LQAFSGYVATRQQVTPVTTDSLEAIGDSHTAVRHTSVVIGNSRLTINCASNMIGYISMMIADSLMVIDQSYEVMAHSLSPQQSL
jgi:hypothetical protein